jgi:glutamate--glyoxylate aminotransferase
MVIINPGNPTGQCLSEANLREILHFCYQENLVLLGDEVYQQNIYQDERPFISARKVNIVLPPNSSVCYLELQLVLVIFLLRLWKVLMGMGPPVSKEVQLISFHTVSKGYWGECGQRGGYFEMTNIPPKVFFLSNRFLLSIIIVHCFQSHVFCDLQY